MLLRGICISNFKITKVAQQFGVRGRIFFRASYNINYNTYDNRYIKVEFDDLYKYLNGKSNLSYSAMNNYYLCAFRFYIANILKLDPFVDTFAAFLGSLFHDCFSKMYNEGYADYQCIM